MGDLHQVTPNLIGVSESSTLEQPLSNIYSRALGARRVVILLWVFTAVVALLIANFFVGYINKALSKLVKVAGEISSYNLTRNVRGWTKDEIESYMGLPTLGMVPLDGKVEECIARGEPIVVKYPWSPVSQELVRIAEELLKSKAGRELEKEKKVGVFERMRKAGRPYFWSSPPPTEYA